MFHITTSESSILWLRRRLELWTCKLRFKVKGLILLGSFAFVFILDWRLEPKRANLALSDLPADSRKI